MAEYIDRDAVVTYLRSRQSEFIDDYGKGWSNGVGTAAQICEKFQAADVAPVRHGRWVRNVKYQPELKIFVQIGSIVCSLCSRQNGVKEPYCPNCGAKMDERSINGEDGANA